MVNSGSSDGEPPADPSPNRNCTDDVDAAAAADSSGSRDPAAPDVAAIVSGGGVRRPFTELSQDDADLALARVLQEQEEAYMMLRMDRDYAGSDAESYNSEEYDEDEEEDDELANGDDAAAVDDHVAAEEDRGEGSAEASVYEEEDDADLDPAEFEDDESYARALQEAVMEVAARLGALSGLGQPEVLENLGTYPHDAWEEFDPDNYSYEELIAIGQVVGTENRGLSADTIASLPSLTYHSPNIEEGNIEQCVVCRVEFEDGNSLTVLPCKHIYHSECINQWLQLSKVCPVCSVEVSTSESK